MKYMQTKIRFDIITLFPEACESYTGSSILKRAQAAGYIEVHYHQLRDFAIDKHHTVDDTPYGGGPGMVLKPEPLFAAISHIREQRPELKTYTIAFAAKGTILKQDAVRKFSTDYERFILIAGRYEGIDERIIEYCVDEEISMGEYVLTGGELPALTFVDAVSRLVPGVLGNALSSVTESHSEEGVYEYPQYTKPEVFNEWAVPEVLLSGNHKAIEEWRENKRPLTRVV